MALALILLPLAAAGVVAAVPSNRWRPWLMPAASLGHSALVAFALVGGEPVQSEEGWLVLDPLGKVFLALVSVLFLVCSVYTAQPSTKTPDPSFTYRSAPWPVSSPTNTSSSPSPSKSPASTPMLAFSRPSALTAAPASSAVFVKVRLR